MRVMDMTVEFVERNVAQLVEIVAKRPRLVFGVRFGGTLYQHEYLYHKQTLEQFGTEVFFPRVFPVFIKPLKHMREEVQFQPYLKQKEGDFRPKEEPGGIVRDGRNIHKISHSVGGYVQIFHGAEKSEHEDRVVVVLYQKRKKPLMFQSYLHKYRPRRVVVEYPFRIVYQLEVSELHVKLAFKTRIHLVVHRCGIKGLSTQRMQAEQDMPFRGYHFSQVGHKGAKGVFSFL